MEAAAAAAHEVGHAVDHARGGLAGFLLAAADTGPYLLWPAEACAVLAAALASLSAPVLCFLVAALAIFASGLASGLSVLLLAADPRTSLFVLGKACAGAAAAVSRDQAAYVRGVASAVPAFAVLGGLPLACLELAGEWRASRWAEDALRNAVPGCARAVRLVFARAGASHLAPGLLWVVAATGTLEAAAGVLSFRGISVGVSAAALLWLVLLWRHWRLGRGRPP